MMKSLKSSDIGVGSIISFFKEESVIYGNANLGNTTYKTATKLPSPRNKIVTARIEGVQEKIRKRDNARQVVGYQVAYETYRDGVRSFSETGFIPSVEMERILSHARLVH